MLNRLRAWWRNIFSTPTMSPSALSLYRQWQQHFLYQRLRLLIWLYVFVLVSITLFEIWLIFMQPNAVNLLDFWINVVLGLVFVIGLGLQTIVRGKCHQGMIFWMVSAGGTLTLLAAGVLVGNIDDSDVAIWSMVFLAQSTIVPVQWKLHAWSQLTLLIPLTILVCIVFVAADTSAERSEVILGTLSAYIYLVWVCIIADVGVYLYERLRYQEFEARQEVRTFLHAVFHDLRNPVTGTQLLIKSLLEQHGETVLIPRSVLKQMLQSGERQLVLINSLLEAHNNNLKGVALQHDNVHLHSLVNSICDELAPQLSAANTTMHNQLSANLPTIPGDSIQLWRVFHNLIINALNHNPPGIEIWVHATVMSAPQPHIRCNVQDNGIGMSAEQCAHLFSLYAQGRRRCHLSVGLGLHIAQQIIDGHHGTIGVDSEVGKGSTFWLTLPLVHPPLA